MQYTYKYLCNIYKKNICNFVTSIAERGGDRAVKEQEKTNALWFHFYEILRLAKNYRERR